MKTKLQKLFDSKPKYKKHIYFVITDKDDAVKFTTKKKCIIGGWDFDYDDFIEHLGNETLKSFFSLYASAIDKTAKQCDKSYRKKIERWNEKIDKELYGKNTI